MIFDKRFFVRNEVLKSDAIYNSSFRFQNIDFNNVNDIYFAINIIVVIAMTFFKIFVVVVFVFKFIIVIVFDVNIVVVIIIVFKKFVFKFIAFGFDIKKRLAMNISFNKS